MTDKKRCLYEVLSVAQDATEAELKKAFRTAALLYHPDKNPGREAEAEEQFKAVQEAQDVLLNSETRAWYDAHRNQIIRGDEPGETPQPADATETDLFAHLENALYDGYHDNEGGFYYTYAQLFAELGREEMFFAGRDVHLTFAPFGASYSDWAVTKAFYDEWGDFNSVKNFGFAEKWNLSEAENRMHRRLMEKENKRASTRAKKEFNGAVRTLVAVLQKRDPRVKRQKKVEERLRQEREKERVLREQREVELRKERAREARIARDQVLEEDAVELDAILAGIELDEKMERKKARRRAQRANGGEQDGDDDEAAQVNEMDSSSEEEEIDEDELYCVACKKKFRTPAQVRNHETSKKHNQAVAKLRKKLEQDEEIYYDARDSEDVIIDTSRPLRPVPVSETISVEEVEEVASEEEVAPEVEEEEDIVDIAATSNKKKKKKNAKKRQQQARFANVDSNAGHANEAAEDQSSQPSENKTDASQDAKKPQMSKKAKRREREKRKAEQQKAENGSGAKGSNKCNVCKEDFPSRTKLMKHVEKSGHALRSS